MNKFDPSLMSRLQAVARAETASPRETAARVALRGVWPAALLFAPMIALALCLAFQIWVEVALGLSLVLFLSALLMKVVLTFAAARFEARSQGGTNQTKPTDQPIVSLLVPVYQEAESIPLIYANLRKLIYPKDRLELIFICEDGDHDTIKAVKNLPKSSTLNLIICPSGTIKTKPRAMNFALPHCAGEIIGIYDAEDAPEPDQASKAVEALLSGDAQLACVQAQLDYDNQNTNWLARCFTIEYALFHRVFNKGLAVLDWPIPLSGTSAFFKRAIVEKIGLWDAHNVTEDAELGLRLYRSGYRCQPLSSITYEEANCRLWPWVKQRSRWMKGFYVTWLCHFRNPLRLHKDIGVFPTVFITCWFYLSLQTALLGPPLLLIGLLEFVLQKTIILPETLSGYGRWFWICLLLSELVNYAMTWLATSRPKHRVLRMVIPSLILYWPLKTLAGLKASYEIITAPSYWDKTQHGVDPMREEWRFRPQR